MVSSSPREDGFVMWSGEMDLRFTSESRPEAMGESAEPRTESDLLRLAYCDAVVNGRKGFLQNVLCAYDVEPPRRSQSFFVTSAARSAMEISCGPEINALKSWSDANGDLSVMRCWPMPTLTCAPLNVIVRGMIPI